MSIIRYRGNEFSIVKNIGRRGRERDECYDLVILGSGAAGLTAALTASLAGLSCLVLEHLDRIGGTSARSSGTVWVPGSRHVADPAADAEDALRYLRALAANRGHETLRTTFVSAAARMEADLAMRAEIAFRAMPTAPDYRQDMPGAAQGHRPLEPLAFDGRRLGQAFEHLAPPLPELMLLGGMMVTRAEAGELLRADRSPRAARLGMQLLARHGRDRLFWPRGTRLVMGNALVARLYRALLDRGATVRRGIRTLALLREAGRIAAVEVDGSDWRRTIMARCGVVLAGGGFPASAVWRGRELPQPVPQHTPASPGCIGRTIELGLEAGAALGPSLGDNALWFPSSIGTRRDGSTAVYPHIALDRGKPGSLAVDSTGARFVNEAVSYHEFVRGMYRHRDTAIPAWLICDSRFIRRYGLGMVRPRSLRLGHHVASGYLARGATLTELANRICVPADALTRTVARFNVFAESGIDADFQRGETSYERAGGDPAHGPNPCLGPIDRGPFYAVALHPTPLGSSRGLAADAHARALDAEGRPMPGLYVCGNDMQSVFAGEYPGAGAQLGQGMTFGWIAARHAAGLATEEA